MCTFFLFLLISVIQRCVLVVIIIIIVIIGEPELLANFLEPISHSLFSPLLPDASGPIRICERGVVPGLSNRDSHSSIACLRWSQHFSILCFIDNILLLDWNIMMAIC